MRLSIMQGFDPSAIEIDGSTKYNIVSKVTLDAFEDELMRI